VARRKSPDVASARAFLGSSVVVPLFWYLLSDEGSRLGALMYTILMSVATGLMIWMAYPYLKFQIQSIRRIRNFRSWKEWKPFLIITAGAISLGLSVWFAKDAFYSSYRQIAAAPYIDSSGTLLLNVQRRDAIENNELREWLSELSSFQQKLFLPIQPTKEQYDALIKEFVEYAETHWSREQLKEFNQLRIWTPIIDVGHYEGVQALTGETRNKAMQLADILGQLDRFINQNSEKTEDTFGL
jgi:hypothetical protein